MKKVVFSVVVLACITVLSGLTASAQEKVVVSFTAANSFYAGNAKMPAGKYTITQLGVGQGNIVRLRNSTGSHEVLLEFTPATSEVPRTSTDVVFNKYGNMDYLKKILLPGSGPENSSSMVFPQTAAENLAAQSGKPTEHSVKAGK